MSVLLYALFVRLYKLAILLASPFNEKASKWIAGRKGVFEYLENSITSTDKVIWVHSASLGEFEQGRPVLERLKADYPTYKILLTFFSPSGYEVQKNYKGADWICYLPMDSAKTAKRFLAITHPCLVIFVKYEFWYYYLKKLKYSQTPLLLIAALFRENMTFFKPHGALARKMLTRFDHLFVQNKKSKDLLVPFGLADKITVAGDTRFDRVIQIKEQFSPIEAVAHFVGKNKSIVAGSTWPGDEEYLSFAVSHIENKSTKLIIAAHEINQAHLDKIESLFENNTCRLSTYDPNKNGNCQVLLIDNYGMLSKLYHYATISYVGGGLHKSGIHNVLEAAVHGKPVFFGPNYKNHAEAIELVKAGGGFPFETKEEFVSQIKLLLNDDALNKSAGEKSMQFVYHHKGSTDKIMNYIHENRLLTN